MEVQLAPEMEKKFYSRAATLLEISPVFPRRIGRKTFRFIELCRDLVEAGAV